MAYATFNQYADRYPDLGVIGEPAEKQALIESLLEDSAADIDRAAESGGYAIPIVMSDLTTDASTITRFEGLLAHHNILLARRKLPNAPDLTVLAKDQLAESDAFLMELRNGRGLAVPAVSLASFCWIKRTHDTAVRQIDVQRWLLGQRWYGDERWP